MIEVRMMSKDDDLDADGGSSGGHGLQGVLDLDQLPRGAVWGRRNICEQCQW